MLIGDSNQIAFQVGVKFLEDKCIYLLLSFQSVVRQLCKVPQRLAVEIGKVITGKLTNQITSKSSRLELKTPVLDI